MLASQEKKMNMKETKRQSRMNTGSGYQGNTTIILFLVLPFL